MGNQPLQKYQNIAAAYNMSIQLTALYNNHSKKAAIRLKMVR
jgi:hypothetical protein